jgi:excisionase family DNA binding protein
MSNELLTVERVAEELSVHPKTVRTWIREGKLVAVDLGKEYRVRRSDLDRFLEERKTDKRK